MLDPASASMNDPANEEEEAEGTPQVADQAVFFTG